MLSEETKNTALEGSAPLCRVGRSMDKPCWRSSMEPCFADEKELELCPEHSRLRDLNEELEDWHRVLDAIEEWLRGPVAEADHEYLTNTALDARNEARREYGRIAVRAHAAGLVADQGPPRPGEVPPFLEVEEEMARRLMRVDALKEAQRVLEDLDEDTVKLSDKWATIDLVAAEDVSEEFMRHREEFGLRPAE